MIKELLISLTTCFVVMKVLGIITWGWLLCFSPFLFLLASYLTIIMVCIAFDVYEDSKYEQKWKDQKGKSD